MPMNLFLGVFFFFFKEEQKLKNCFSLRVKKKIFFFILFVFFKQKRGECHGECEKGAGCFVASFD
jgi:hypothetical protein